MASRIPAVPCLICGKSITDARTHFVQHHPSRFDQVERMERRLDAKRRLQRSTERAATSTTQSRTTTPHTTSGTAPHPGHLAPIRLGGSSELRFTRSVEGYRAWITDRLVAVLHRPRAESGDWWCQVHHPEEVRKGLTPESARDWLVATLRQREEKRKDAECRARDVPQPRPAFAPPGSPVAATLYPVSYAMALGIAGADAAYKEPARKTLKPVTPSAPLVPCPVCGEMIGRKLKRHLRRKHAERVDAGPAAEVAIKGRTYATPPQAATKLPPSRSLTTTRTPQKQRQRALANRALPAKSLPISAKPAEYPKHFQIAVQGSGAGASVKCPVCNLRLGPERIWEHLGRSHPKVDSANWSLAVRTDATCERASPERAAVNASAKSDGRHHLTKTKRKTSAKRTASHLAKKLQRVHKGVKARKFRDRSISKTEQDAEHALDATRLYAERYRERGRFGSHAAHDGYDDDHSP